MKYPVFYDEMAFTYPEIGVVLEKPTTRMVKICIPAITPFIDNNEPYDKLDIDYSKSNLMNKDKTNLDIKKCTVSNYIELSLPEYLNISDINKGDKVVLSFIGGDINKPYIIGRY